MTAGPDEEMAFSTIYLPNEMDTLLRDLAFRRNMSKPELIRDALASSGHRPTALEGKDFGIGRMPEHVVLRTLQVPHELDVRLSTDAAKFGLERDHFILLILATALRKWLDEEHQHAHLLLRELVQRPYPEKPALRHFKAPRHGSGKQADTHNDKLVHSG